MTGNDYWIQELLCWLPWSCAEPEHVSSRQDALRWYVLQRADSYDNGRELLREACLCHLGDGEWQTVENALSCLFVVGLGEDIEALSSLTSHASERVRVVAGTCLMELRKRR